MVTDLLHTTSAHLDELYRIYEAFVKAGEVMCQEPSHKLDTLIRRRWRLLRLAQEKQQDCKTLLQECKASLSPRDNAFLEEKKRRISDLKPKVMEQYRKLQRFLSEQMSRLKSKQTDAGKKSRAIRAYAKNSSAFSQAI
jgi:uridine kinase